MAKKTVCRFCKATLESEFKICKYCGKSDPLGIEDEIRSLISQGKKIEAVKRVQELTVKGLRISKEYVDSLC